MKSTQRTTQTTTTTTIKSNFKSNSTLITILLLVLVPSSVIGLLVLPLLALLCIVPIIGFFSFPSLLSVAFYLVYSLSWSLYLLLAQHEPPANSSSPFLPYSPLKCWKVTSFFLKLIYEALSVKAIHLFLQNQVQRVIVLGGKEAKDVLKENILYRESLDPRIKGKRLDLYLPIRRRFQGDRGVVADNFDEASEGSNRGLPLSPVVIFVGGGNWSFWRKAIGSMVALRLRRMGYLVIVPDLSNYPRKCSDTVSDFRYVAEWTAARAEFYGGDPDQLFVMGYGSGAHIALLTMVQEAVVTSRDEYQAQLASPAKDRLPPIEISAGIRRVEIYGEEALLPNFAGVILISGVYDLIKQLRRETADGIEDISALRRFAGPGTSTTLLNCPSHLLYGSKELLDPTLLPPKFLIIAGGNDTLIPYAQAVLLRNLLSGVGVSNVTLKLYKEESHFGSLASLMHQTRYSPLILSEIDEMISGDRR